MTSYMREKATGQVHAVGRNEAKLFDGAPDGYEYVLVLPVVWVNAVGRTLNGSRWMDERGVAVSIYDDDDLDSIERRALLMYAAAQAERGVRQRKAQEAADAEREKRALELVEDIGSAIGGVSFPEAPSTRILEQIARHLEGLGYRRGVQ